MSLTTENKHKQSLKKRRKLIKKERIYLKSDLSELFHLYFAVKTTTYEQRRRKKTAE